jgi:hypothetical protein
LEARRGDMELIVIDGGVIDIISSSDAALGAYFP